MIGLRRKGTGNPRWPAQNDGSLLLVLPVPFSHRDGDLMLESQACNGAARWAENFQRVTLAAPLMPPDQVAANPTIQWGAVRDVQHAERLRWAPLPWAYAVASFFRQLGPTRRALAQLIGEHYYLHFAIGGWIGDWAAQAALLAHRLHRPFSIWTDQVFHQAVRALAPTGENARRRFYARLAVPFMRRLEHRVVRYADLGMFHGGDTFQYYGPLSPNPQLCHDVHTKEHDRIDRAAVEEKLRQVRGGRPLRLCYVGRAVPMKAPLDWLGALLLVRQAGVDFRAIWQGQGPLRPEMEAFIREHGLTEHVHLPEHHVPHVECLRLMRDSDILLFTHITPESPRCLVEGLLSACALVGYGSEYSRGLTRQGGVFVEPQDVEGLAREIVALNGDRSRLASLIEHAYEDGAEFTDAHVFRDCSDLIKRYLTAPQGKAPA